MDILAILQRLGMGRTLGELEDALVSTAEEVVATGRPGMVTLALRITTTSQGNPQVAIAETISRSVPKKAPRGAAFYAVNGGLFKEDPRQEQMDFRTVETKSEVRELEPREKVERKVQ